jgi:hypothetical protein
MRTVLCTTAGRRTLLLTLAVGVAGAVTLPAAVATSSSAAQHPRPEPAPVTAADEVGDPGVAVLGPAVKYVRGADGTVRRVR